MTTAGRQPYWTFGVFVYAVLLLLIAVPFLMTYRAGTVIADVDRFADPAAKAASRIQAELSHEASAIVGFQTVGGIARLSAMVSIGLAVLALVASVFINKIFSRLSEASAYLEHRAKEDEGL